MKRTLKPKLTPALLGLAFACAIGISPSAQAQRVPQGTNEIAYSDFDNLIPSGTYGYWYSGPVDVSSGAPQYFDITAVDELINPENGPVVGRFTFEATQFEGTEAVATGWWGCGFGGAINWTTNSEGISNPDPTLFISLDPADYVLTFDARVEGLVPDQATADCDMEFRVGTGGGSGWVMVKQFRYHPGTNWTHFRFTLEGGNWITADQSPATSNETFTNAIVAGTITTIAWNQNQPNPRLFGFDGDNAIVIDNVKLEVLRYAGPPPPPPPKVAFPILDYNFDDKGLWWIWPNGPTETTTGWSANDNKATYWGVNPLVGEGVEGSQAMAIAMDNTAILTDPPGVPAWAGGNAQGGGQGNYSLITSPSLKDYRINLQARAAGLADDLGSTPVVFQLIINAPDDTLQPADDDTGRDMLLRLNATINNVKSTWQNFVVYLSDASVDSGSLANFQANLNKIDEITFQLQIQNPHADTVWGLDANNMIIVDNVKLERLVEGSPALTIQIIDGKSVVTWGPPSAGTAKLLSGTTMANITNEVVGATSPYTNAVSSTPTFFRTQWVPPAN